MDSIYCVYSQSPKNLRELKSISAELEAECTKIGKVLSVRWVASSYRTVSAVWRSYRGLCEHFERVSLDKKRDGKERQKFKGLHQRLSSKEFLCDLAIMYDVLLELSQLSL